MVAGNSCFAVDQAMPAGDRVESIVNQIAAAFCWGGATMSVPRFGPLMLLVVRSEPLGTGGRPKPPERDLGISSMISNFTNTIASFESTVLRV